MKNILIIGAGRSSGDLVKYLSDKAEEHNWWIRLGDYNFSLAEERSKNSGFITPFQLDITDAQQLYKEIDCADIVVSMVPAHMHFPVAKFCVELGKSMVTASYVSPELKELHEKALAKDVLILMECGLDPGLDHMSAMKSIDEIKSRGGELTLFKSFTGGLVAPECSNLWDYKFTWNPRNVVLAGQGVSKFIRNNRYKYIPYHRLFSRVEDVLVDDFGVFEAYANRDSLKYQELYQLQDIPTLFRGTLREKHFCEFWDVFVQLGLTDDSYFLTTTDGLTNRSFINSFLPFSSELRVEEKLKEMFSLQEEDAVFQKLKALDLFEDRKLNLEGKVSPAMVLQAILMEKWTLSPEDRDMVVMQHQFEFKLDGKLYRRTSSFGLKGEKGGKTAMSKAVGLPVAIAVEEILKGNLVEKGVQIPVLKSIYDPILKVMEADGIVFSEQEGLVE